MRYIIVGFGNIGHKRAKVLGKKLVATVDPRKDSGSDYKDSKDLPLDIFDNAVLTVPQQFKFDLTKYFLSRGKHVLNEKPFIVTKKQLDELKKISKKNNVIFFTSYNHRFEPNIKRMKNDVQSGDLGKFYYGRMIYSFGNIQERLGTWRETEFGVLEEIAPHLIDIAINILGYKGSQFKTVVAAKIESKIFDHWIFSTTDGRIMFETSSLSWKNIFSIELYFEKGSLHLKGLRKWGQSRYTKMRRILPSGIPKEKVYEDSGEDLTWKEDFIYFEKIVKSKQTSSTSDLQMSAALASIALGSRNPDKNGQEFKLFKQILKK